MKELFMWDHQKHFQISLQLSADELFNQVDKKLKPHVFLLGILAEHREGRSTIALEPEECGYHAKAFFEVKKLAQELEKADEETQIFHTHPVAQQRHAQKISDKAIKESIFKILKREDTGGLSEKFISSPTYVNDYIVFVVLEIQKDALDKYYSLTKEKPSEGIRPHRCFTDSLIDVFLKEATNGLKDPKKVLKVIDRPIDELLRESAKQFMYTISQSGENPKGLHGLYDACNAIASLKYEGNEGLGKMIIAKKDHYNIRFTLELEEPILIRDFRKVRKFLELSNDTSIIISDAAFIYGLGEQTGKYNPKDESLFVINFLSHFKWEVLHDDNPMLIVEYNNPNLPKERIERDKFYSDFRRIFSDIDTRKIDDLWDITSEVTKQTHGTMLVITDNAKDEAQRLGKQSFSLKPLKITTSLVQQITAIDGAVLLDRDCTCHAIGVILDGLATNKGDASRGARYNSAIRYFEQFGRQHPTIIVVVSEDGMINLIPNLKPQVEHSKIKAAIEELKTLGEAEKFDPMVYNQIITFLENNEFYLSQSECDQINSVREQVELVYKDTPNIKLMHRHLKVNPEMNESYYS